MNPTEIPPKSRRAPRILLKKSARAHYHIVSRVVDRSFPLTDTDKEAFQRPAFGGWQSSAASCVCSLMPSLDNHFHLLVEVPASPGEPDDEELSRRGQVWLYGQERKGQPLSFFRIEPGASRQAGGTTVERMRTLLIGRMASLPNVRKESSSSASPSSTTGSTTACGTLWEDRFHSVFGGRFQCLRFDCGGGLHRSELRACGARARPQGLSVQRVWGSSGHTARGFAPVSLVCEACSGLCRIHRAKIGCALSSPPSLSPGLTRARGATVLEKWALEQHPYAKTEKQKLSATEVAALSASIHDAGSYHRDESLHPGVGTENKSVYYPKKRSKETPSPLNLFHRGYSPVSSPLKSGKPHQFSCFPQFRPCS